MAYKPTKEDADRVETLAALGFPHEDIGRVLKISAPTLRKHYRDLLDTAMHIANSEVGTTLFRMATSGDCPAATIFWMKCRRRWRETTDSSVTVAGEPLKRFTVTVGPDPASE